MDENGSPSLLNLVHPENLSLVVTHKPFRQSQDESWAIRSVQYRDYDLFICYGGEAAFTLEGREYRLGRSQALLVPPAVTVNARKTSRENFDAVAQHFELKLFGTLDFLSLFTYRKLVSLTHWAFVRETFLRYADLALTEQNRLLRHGLFFSVLGEVLSDAYERERENIDHRYRFVFDLASEIERNLGDEHVVEKALAKSPYSPDYTARMFRRQTGTPPRKYFTLCRLRAGKESLLAGSTVKEASQQAGFKDELYFSRLFTKYEGMSPKDYQYAMGVKRRG